MLKSLIKETFGFVFNPVKLIKMIWPWCVLYALYVFGYNSFSEEQLSYRLVLKVLLLSLLGVMLALGLSFEQKKKRFPFGFMELNYFFSLTAFVVFPTLLGVVGLSQILMGMPCESCGRLTPLYGRIFGGGFFSALMFYVMIRLLPALPEAVLLKQKTWQSVKKAWKVTGACRLSILAGFLVVFLMVVLLTFLSAVFESLFSGVSLSSEAFLAQSKSIGWVFDFVFWIFFLSFVSVLYKILFPQAQSLYEKMAVLTPARDIRQEGSSMEKQQTEEQKEQKNQENKK